MVAVWRMARLEEVRPDWETNEQSPAERRKRGVQQRLWASGLDSQASRETGLEVGNTVTLPLSHPGGHVHMSWQS